MQAGDALASETWALQWGERSCRARVITQREKDQFSSWIAQRVIREFLSGQDGGSPALERAVALVSDRIAAGHYGFHGEVAQRALQNPDGIFTLSRLVFEVAPPGQPYRPITEDEMVRLMSEKGPEVKLLMQQVFARSFPQVVRSPSSGEGADPNPRGLGAGSPSGPATPTNSSAPA